MIDLGKQIGKKLEKGEIDPAKALELEDKISKNMSPEKLEQEREEALQDDAKTNKYSLAHSIRHGAIEGSKRRAYKRGKIANPKKYDPVRAPQTENRVFPSRNQSINCALSLMEAIINEALGEKEQKELDTKRRIANNLSGKMQDIVNNAQAKADKSLDKLNDIDKEVRKNGGTTVVFTGDKIEDFSSDPKVKKGQEEFNKATDEMKNASNIAHKYHRAKNLVDFYKTKTDEALQLAEAICDFADNLFELDYEQKQDISPNKIKKTKKDKNGERVDVVSVADELFPYEGTAKQQFNQKILDKINAMIEGTGSLEDLIQFVRAGAKVKKTANEGYEAAEEILEEVINAVDKYYQGKIDKAKDNLKAWSKFEKHSDKLFKWANKKRAKTLDEPWNGDEDVVQNSLKGTYMKKQAKKNLEDLEQKYAQVKKNREANEGYEIAGEILEAVINELDDSTVKSMLHKRLQNQRKAWKKYGPMKGDYSVPSKEYEKAQAEYASALKKLNRAVTLADLRRYRQEGNKYPELRDKALKELSSLRKEAKFWDKEDKKLNGNENNK